MKKGFTLIELMVTIAVIGLLAAIALPRFSNITKDAEIAQLQANRKNIETALHMYLVKEDKKVEDLFREYKQAYNNPPVYGYDKEIFKSFFKYYEKEQLPYIPGTKRNEVYWVDVKEFNYSFELLGEIAKVHWDKRTGWIFTSDGNVYPAVAEEDYGIRFDEF